jgi:hypothetical protein
MQRHFVERFVGGLALPSEAVSLCKDLLRDRQARPRRERRHPTEAVVGRSRAFTVLTLFKIDAG